MHAMAILHDRLMLLVPSLKFYLDPHFPTYLNQIKPLYGFLLIQMFVDVLCACMSNNSNWTIKLSHFFL